MNEVGQEQQLDMHVPNNTFLTINGFLSEGKWFARPLVIQIEKDDGEIVVSEPYFSIHASAPTVSEAITEFKRVLADELEELTADEEKLGPRLKAELHYLRTAIRTA